MSDKKNILITGATSGIGLAIANLLNNRGYNTILVGRDAEKLARVSSCLNDSLYVVCDLENTLEIKSIFDFLKSNEIMLDGMVHAAGYVINVPIRSYSIDHMEKQMKVHYFAFLELCKQFYSKRVSNNGSSILAISSLASFTALKGSSLYAASKSALNTAVSVSSKEFIKRMIRVNALLPAYVDTRMTAGLDELIDVSEKQPMGMIPPDSIADVAEFLLSDKSKYITGALIPISAGMEF